MMSQAATVADNLFTSETAMITPERRKELLNRVLLLEHAGGWTIEDALQGTIILGGNGSGKTSGSGATIAQGLLQAGIGGLVLTARDDEAARWSQLASATGRSADLVLVSASDAQPLECNAFAIAERLNGAVALTQRLSSLVTELLRAGGDQRESLEPFWDHAAEQLVSNVIDLLVLCGEPPRLSLVAKLAREATATPEKQKQLGDFCDQLRRLTNGTVLSRARLLDAFDTLWYFEHELPSYEAKTRSSLLATLMSQLQPMLRSPFRSFVDGSEQLPLEETLAGKIIVLDFPVSRYGSSGRLLQILLKMLWQRMVDARGRGAPTFLWADEAQYFLTPQDLSFLQTARGHDAIVVMLTQSIANLEALSSDQGTGTAEAMLGNFQTKIFHANACTRTNAYAEQLIGSVWHAKLAISNHGTSVEQQYQPLEPARTFTMLPSGGSRHGHKIDALLVQSGRVWPGTDNRVRLTLDQWYPD